jgi:glycosyltransferase involved in cell wall biosynthesis
MQRPRLAVISTHPIQYYAPVFRAIASGEEVILRVFFTWSQSAEGAVFDPGFGARFAWDVPLLDGYDHQFVENRAKRPGSAHFFGIRNPGLNREIADWDPDAVLVYGWNLYSHLQALRHFKGKVPVLFRGDSTLLNEHGAAHALARRIVLRWIYSHVDVPISVGSNNRDYYLWSGVPAERIAFAPHSVDTVRFADVAGDHRQAAMCRREELGIAPETIVFVFAGKLVAVKDPAFLLRAFMALKSVAHLVFVGDGALETELRTEALCSPNIHFLPFQNQSAMPAVYRIGDAFILPSRSETWGLALNEAMACGRPIIASSRVGGARDLVRDGVTGWMFQSGRGDDLMRVLRLAIDTGREGLGQMGRNAQTASAGWSSEAAAQSIVTAVKRAHHAHAVKMRAAAPPLQS